MNLKDPIYIEMMNYYDSKSTDFDNYWNKNMYPQNEENILLFKERDEIDTVAKLFGKGSCIDLGCGTSHWLNFYHSNCTQVTLVDQSENMLDISKEKSKAFLNGGTTFSFIKSDIFDLNIETNKFDSLLVGNLLGHLTDSMMAALFVKINLLLKENSSIFISDSLLHSGIKIESIENNIQIREAAGKEFKIYKRYFTREFIEQLLKKYNYQISSTQFWGKYFFGIIAAKNGN
jgi:SAM-dependent methyltransferase